MTKRLRRSPARRAWTRLRLRLARWADPDAIERTSYRDMALDNAADAMRAEDEQDGFAYPPPPQPGADFDLVDVDPEQHTRLSARMEEVYVYGERQKTRRARTRRQWARLAVVTGLATFAVASMGASSVGVEVPLVDDLVHDDEPDPGTVADLFARAPNAFRPPSSLGVVGTPRPVRWSADSPRFYGLSYRNEAGSLCMTIPRSGQTTSGCIHPDQLVKEIRGEKVLLAGFVFGRRLIVRGLADASVDKVAVRGPAGPMRVRMTMVWRPKLPDLPGLELRAWEAQGRAPGLNGKTSTKYADPRRYHVRALN